MVRRDTSGEAMAAALAPVAGPPVTLSGRRADLIHDAMMEAAEVLRRHGETSKVYRGARQCFNARVKLESALTLFADTRKQGPTVSEGSGEGEGVGAGAGNTGT